MSKNRNTNDDQQPEQQYKRLVNVQAGANSTGAMVEEIPYERLENVWAQRAVQLARMPEKEQSGDQVEVLLIRLGREILGIEVSLVVEIRRGGVITRVPRVPAWVVGVTNLRGQILSVINLRLFLGLPEKPSEAERAEDGDRNELFMIEVESPMMGLVLQVDDVLGVEKFPVNEIRAESGLFHSLPPDYLRGVVKHKQRRRSTGQENGTWSVDKATVSILSLDKLMSDPRIIINDYIDEDNRRL